MGEAMMQYVWLFIIGFSLGYVLMAAIFRR
jgi:hypothetical protein